MGQARSRKTEICREKEREREEHRQREEEMDDQKETALAAEGSRSPALPKVQMSLPQWVSVPTCRLT